MDLATILNAFLSSKSGILGTWLGASGAIAAWLTILFEVRRRQAERFTSLKDAYDDLFEHREIFWTELRSAYECFRLNESTAPTDLEALLRSAGSPPGLGNLDLVSWPAAHASRLGPDKRTIWSFAQAIYPARGNLSGRVTDHSLIATYSAGRVEDFHKARASHAKFWNKWAQLLPKRYISRSYVSAHDQWIVLSWLEVALAQWTRDPGPGKVWLFRLANYAGSK